MKHIIDHIRDGHLIRVILPIFHCNISTSSLKSDVTVVVYLDPDFL